MRKLKSRKNYVTIVTDSDSRCAYSLRTKHNLVRKQYDVRYRRCFVFRVLK